jgi:hypothetical protein
MVKVEFLQNIPKKSLKTIHENFRKRIGEDCYEMTILKARFPNRV